MVYDKDMCKSKLGILMCVFRADRPSEWQMDEFIHHAEDMNNKINELTKQRDELLYALKKIASVKPSLMHDENQQEVIVYSPYYNPFKIARDAIADKQEE